MLKFEKNQLQGVNVANVHRKLRHHKMSINKSKSIQMVVLYISLGKNEYVQKPNEYFNTYMPHVSVVINETTLTNNVHNSSDYTHVRNKLYREFIKAFFIYIFCISNKRLYYIGSLLYMVKEFKLRKQTCINKYKIYRETQYYQS